jgi:hypothetical protein
MVVVDVKTEKVVKAEAASNIVIPGSRARKSLGEPRRRRRSVEEPASLQSGLDETRADWNPLEDARGPRVRRIGRRRWAGRGDCH